jgi:CRP/FNR family cyclic AMP-dependent transcriptional regulator
MPPHKPVSIWRFPLFADLPEADIVTILQYSKSLLFQPGDLVFKEGDTPDGLYLVLSGALRYFITVDDIKRKTVGEVNPGEYVGEFSLLDGQPRSTSLEAILPSEVLMLPAKAFETILKMRPSVALGVHRKLCEVIRRRTGRRLPDPKGPVSFAQLCDLARILREYNDQLSSRR